MSWNTVSNEIVNYANGIAIGKMNVDPLWSPDGQKVFFGMNFDGTISHARILDVVLSEYDVFIDYSSPFLTSGTLFTKGIQIFCEQWDKIVIDKTIESGVTQILTQVKRKNRRNGTYHTISEVYIPNNNVGSDLNEIDLSGLPQDSLFANLRLRFFFSTSDNSKSPKLNSWEIVCPNGVSKEAIEAQIMLLQPGDELIFPSGRYALAFEINISGTEENPIVLKGQAANTVVVRFVQILIKGNYVHLSDMVFSGIKDYVDPKIAFVRCHHSRMSNIEMFDSGFLSFIGSPLVYIFGEAKNNRVDHCYFHDFISHGVTIIGFETFNASLSNSNNTIDHNIFKDVIKRVSNGGECLMIGSGYAWYQPLNTKFEHNMYYNVSGDSEIISLKSAGNEVRNNVFMKSFGGLNLRAALNNIVEQNFFIGLRYRNAIVLYGDGHIIKDNFFLNNSNDLSIPCGTGYHDPNEVSPIIVGPYLQPRNTLSQSNTFVGSKENSLRICENYMNQVQWRPYQVPPITYDFSYLPQNTMFRNNIFAPGKGKFLNSDSSINTTFEDNILYLNASWMNLNLFDNQKECC